MNGCQIIMSHIGKVQVWPSTTAGGGRGVFARRTYAVNQVLTEYVGCFCDAGSKAAEDSEHVLRVSLRKLSTTYTLPKEDVHDQEIVSLDMIGDPLSINPKYAGALINDLDYEFNSSTKQFQPRLHMANEKRANVMVVAVPRRGTFQTCRNTRALLDKRKVNVRLFIVATRTIAENEELSLAYGSEYWSAHNDKMRSERE